MAKGNDGNYLQHCVEVEAAVLLSQTDPNRRLHIALTHGMAPFEKIENPNVQKKLLCNALAEAAGEPKCDEREIVKAYRKSEASPKHYPNSAELLRAAIGTNRLSGGITECNKAKHEGLAKAWNNSKVKVFCSSWREQLEPGGVLSCPKSLDVPWLFSMDPMTYTKNGDKRENLNGSDLNLLSRALERYVRSGQPGIACVFVFGLGRQRENRQCQFWAFMDKLAKERLNVPTLSYWVAHNGGNLNLAGLLFSDAKLTKGFHPPGIELWSRREN